MKTFQIKPNIAGHLIVFLAVLLLMSITFWAFFLKEEPVEFGQGGIIIIAIIGGIGSIVLYMSLKTMIQRPAIITINENGFEYNPGGVSSGWIPWTNVAEVKSVEVRTQQGNLNGPIWERTLAVKLKDPAPYRDQYNVLLRGLMKLNDNMYDADIFFRLSSFGKQVDEVITLMNQHWKASKATHA